MHAFLVEAGVDLKSQNPRKMSSLIRILYAFSTPFYFIFLFFYKHALILVEIWSDIAKAGSVNSCGQCQLTFLSRTSFHEFQLLIN